MDEIQIKQENIEGEVTPPRDGDGSMLSPGALNHPKQGGGSMLSPGELQDIDGKMSFLNDSLISAGGSEDGQYQYDAYYADPDDFDPDDYDPDLKDSDDGLDSKDGSDDGEDDYEVMREMEDSAQSAALAAGEAGEGEGGDGENAEMKKEMDPETAALEASKNIPAPNPAIEFFPRMPTGDETTSDKIPVTLSRRWYAINYYDRLLHIAHRVKLHWAEDGVKVYISGLGLDEELTKEKKGFTGEEELEALNLQYCVQAPNEKIMDDVRDFVRD